MKIIKFALFLLIAHQKIHARYYNSESYERSRESYGIYSASNEHHEVYRESKENFGAYSESRENSYESSWPVKSNSVRGFEDPESFFQDLVALPFDIVNNVWNLVDSLGISARDLLSWNIFT